MPSGADANNLPGWKTVSGKTEFMSAYDAALALWPVPYEAIYVPTRWGETHVLASGPHGAPPLVLLHGFYATASMWYPNVAALSQHYRVYMPDELGQPGKTVPTRNIVKAIDLAEWLLDVFQGLGLQRADVAGHSYGGWLTVNLALHAPRVVRRLVLLSPAGTVTSMRKRFMLFALPMILWPSDFAINAFFGWLRQGYAADARLMRLINLGVRHWKPGSTGVYPAAYSDEELQRLAAPTLLLIGEREVIYNRQLAVDRARRLIPHLQASFVPNASHLLTAEQADDVNARMLAFLSVESNEAVPA